MNTNSRIMAALQTQFPVGSPNITVSDPWVKKAETCTWTTDSNLVHHFEDTVYEPTNDICSLSPGEYTWIVTSDYQISIGKFPNTYEFTSKHANLALMRTGYVAGELAIIPATPNSKAMKGWNLLSVRYPPLLRVCACAFPLITPRSCASSLGYVFHSYLRESESK